MNATVAVSAGRSATRPGPRFDRWFFPGMVLAMMAMVLTGFAHFYWRGGLILALSGPAHALHDLGASGHIRWAELLQNLHGPVGSAWMMLLLVQASLASARRVRIHRRLGLIGLALSVLVVLTSFGAAADVMSKCARSCTPEVLEDLQRFYATVDVDLLIFTVLIACAFAMRKRAATHKRLILMATISILSPAPFRYAFVQGSVEGALLITYVFVLLLVVYDLWSLHEVHQATLWSGCFMISAQQIGFPIGRTAAGHAFATWLTSLAV
jgi:hypothetical protein